MTFVCSFRPGFIFGVSEKARANENAKNKRVNKSTMEGGFHVLPGGLWGPYAYAIMAFMSLAMMAAIWMGNWGKPLEKLKTGGGTGKDLGQSKVEGSKNNGKARGKLVLVGAGPGDPDLLTVAALKVLNEAELVICDRLVSKEILALCKGEVVMSRKFKGCAKVAQEEINTWMVEALQAGTYVARLKGGDPFIFGRGMEEIKYVEQHGFDVKVIPGLSSALAAPLSAGLSLTDRGVANQICIATGHGKNDSFTTVPKYESDRTIVLLMSVSRAGMLSKGMIRDGYPCSIPVMVVENATTSSHRVINATLESLEIVARDEKISSPATMVIGWTVSSALARKIHYERGGVCFSATM